MPVELISSEKKKISGHQEYTSNILWQSQIHVLSSATLVNCQTACLKCWVWKYNSPELWEVPGKKRVRSGVCSSFCHIICLSYCMKSVCNGSCVVTDTRPQFKEWPGGIQPPKAIYASSLPLLPSLLAHSWPPPLLQRERW